MTDYQTDYVFTADGDDQLDDLEIRGMTLWATRVAVDRAKGAYRAAILSRIHTDPDTLEVLITPNPDLLRAACSVPPRSLIPAMEALERAFLAPKVGVPHQHAAAAADGRVPCDSCEALISTYEAEGNHPRASRLVCNECADAVVGRSRP